MNGGPYRSPSQPDDRRVINRSGSASTYRADEPQKEAPVASSTGRPTPPRQDAPSSGNKPLRWIVRTLVIFFFVVLIGALGWLVWTTYSKNNSTGIDSSKYQAVFLSNGQIYFGKLSDYNDESFRLSTGYLAQSKADTATTEETTTEEDTTSGIVLIRLADETYGPENELFISKEQILHYENLKSDSQYAKLIDQNEASKK